MRRYHWILTLQVFKPHGGMSSFDSHGTVTPAEGGTRQSVFESAKAYACEEAGVDPARTVVAFWVLEPDELS